MKRCQTCNTIGGDNQTTCYIDGQSLVEDPLATTLQKAIGAKYSLTQLIGKGAMGAVYRAHHRDLSDVAIKVMLGRGDNQALSERFLREARALRRLPVAAYRELRQSDKDDRWGDIKRLELQRGYSQSVLETLAALIARTN